MNTINKSTNYSPFQSHFGHSSCIIPPLLPTPPNPSNGNITAREIIENIQIDVTDAQDNLLLSKISKSFYSNSKSSHKNDFTYNIGDKVMLRVLSTVAKTTNLKVTNVLPNLCLISSALMSWLTLISRLQQSP